MARITIRVTDVHGGRIQIAGVESQLKRGPLRQVIDRKGVLVKNEAVRTAPVSKGLGHPKAKPPPTPGKLKRSIYAKATTVDGYPAVEIGAKVPYIQYVVGGTSAHEIRPVRAKALAFAMGPGYFVVTKRVWHPGNAPNPFLRTALKAASL